MNRRRSSFLEKALTTLRFRVTDSTVSTALLTRFRQLTSLSISEIRSRVIAGDPVFEITPFQSDWQDQRRILVQVARDISGGLLPLTVTEQFASREEPVSIEMLHNLIKHFRQIELETQRDTMLENGEIVAPSEFTTFDEDWTQ